MAGKCLSYQMFIIPLNSYNTDTTLTQMFSFECILVACLCLVCCQSLPLICTVSEVLIFLSMGLICNVFRRSNPNMLDTQREVLDTILMMQKS